MSKKRKTQVVRKRTSTQKAKVPVDVKHVPGTKASPQKREGFSIVGIGASAGGLEALERFVKNVPQDCNLAFVVVQHLDPTHKGMMVELLQRSTKMQVVQVKDKMRIRPSCVYVIPPNKDMSVLHGALYLLDPIAPRGHRLAIDFFFRSLAEDQRQQSIGVILSGMGSDGTLGMKAIKEKGGVVFVQEPASAKFDGMPRSAIESGLVDAIAPVEELPGRIIAFLENGSRIAKTGVAKEEKARSALDKIVILLRMQSGHDFSYYKKTTIYRRIERRMSIHQIDEIATYVRFLQENPQELELLFHELLIGVTNFFRDPSMWEHLKTKVIPSLLATRLHTRTLRAWVPGCSTGEEAYSLAMVFQETLEQLEPAQGFSLQIFATDLDRDAVEKARRGLFPENIAADVSPERLERFFARKQDGYEIAKRIRDMIIFAPQNVIMEPPFTKLDILSCRNLLIYFTPELQKRLIPLFHYCLNPRGLLFFGNSETIGSFTDLFQAVEGEARIYQKVESSMNTTLVEFPATHFSPAQVEEMQRRSLKSAASIKEMADELILQGHAPAAVLVQDKGDIVYISGRTGKYIEPAAGKANWNIFSMAREGLRHELMGAFRRALRKRAVVRVKNVQIEEDGRAQAVDITIQPLEKPEGLKGMVMIVFTESALLTDNKGALGARHSSRRALHTRQLEQNLERARHEVETVREQMQTSQEELKSANEELQSTNEELQSTNEELTTSKEEMQSMNEELQTVNHELQTKVDELTQTNNDFNNLLNSTEIATLFLDDALRIRRFTRKTMEITRVIDGDVGRPVTDISSELFYPGLARDAKEVLRSLAGLEKQVAVSTGRWYSIRILPYRTLDNMIIGVVITFTDITMSKTLESEYKEVHEDLQRRFAIQTKDLDKSREDLKNEQFRTAWRDQNGG